MNRSALTLSLFLLSLASADALAQESDNSDTAVEATIRLMGTADAARPEAVTREITLPAALAEDVNAVSRAEQGLGRANERNDRREAGLATADAAKAKGAEMAESARSNREDRGRSDDRPTAPERPVPPAPPEPPGPPGGP